MDVIVSHVNADFDSLGAMVGASLLYPGSVKVLVGTPRPNVRRFLSLHQEVLATRYASDVDPETITRVVVVDASSRRRLGPAGAWLELPGVEVDLYDHHCDQEVDFTTTLSCREAWGSASAIVAHTLKSREETPTPIEATAMLLGIYEDTGSLAFGGTTPYDLEAAAWLLRSGGDLDVVNEFTRQSLTPPQRKLFQEAMSRAEVRLCGGVPVLFATLPSGPHVEEAAVLVPRLMEAEDAEAGFLIAPMEGSLYVIGRSRGDAVNVGAALTDLGGGGHARAASARLKLPESEAETIKQRLIEGLEPHLTPEANAREIMSRPVRTIGPDATVAEARRKMVRYGHSGLVVLEDGKLTGILTRRDADKARHHQLEHSPVRGYMTREVKTVGPDAPLRELEETMIAAGIGRLPVVRDDEILGIVTRRDLLRALHGARYLKGSRVPLVQPVVEILRERLPARAQWILEGLGELAAREGAEAYLVGGLVRDLLLGVRNLDVDILVEPDGLALARVVAQEWAGVLKRAEQFGTAKVRLPDGFEIDFATARTESYTQPGALPDVEPSSITDDLRRRDFTINAMAIDLRPDRFGQLVDPFHGRSDLEHRCLRVLHALSFVEDPTRILRGVRFEERFNFRMERHTEELARRAVQEGFLGRISPERLRAQLFLTLKEEKPVGSLLRLEELGVFEWLTPGWTVPRKLVQAVPGALAWWEQHAPDAPADRSLAFLAALLQPLSPDAAERAATERLRVPPPAWKTIEAALQAAARADELLPAEERPAGVVRRLKDLPPEAIVLLRAALAGGEETPARGLLGRFVEEWRKIKLEIGGEDLKALGFPSGPALGAALRATLEARLNGEIEGRDAELELARTVLSGLSGGECKE